MWPSMIATLGANVKPFERDLARAGTFADKWSRDLSQKFNKKLFNAVGAFGMAGAATSFVTSIFGRADEIKSLAEQWKMTTDEIQRLETVANNTGVSLKRLVELSASGNEEVRRIIETVSAAGGAGISQDQLRDIQAAAGMLRTLLNDTKAFWATQMVKLFSRGLPDEFEKSAAKNIPAAMRVEVARRTGIQGGQFAALTALQASGRVPMSGTPLPEAQLAELQQIHEDLIRIANAVEKQTVKSGSDFYTPLL